VTGGRDEEQRVDVYSMSRSRGLCLILEIAYLVEVWLHDAKWEAVALDHKPHNPMGNSGKRESVMDSSGTEIVSSIENLLDIDCGN
jgi:hypothetical protein